MWDYDTVNPDDFLGRVVIPLRDIATNTSAKDMWYPLTCRGTKEGVSGSVCLRMELKISGGKVSK